VEGGGDINGLRAATFLRAGFFAVFFGALLVLATAVFFLAAVFFGVAFRAALFFRVDPAALRVLVFLGVAFLAVFLGVLARRLEGFLAALMGARR
jgi:hypothetical protein